MLAGNIRIPMGLVRVSFSPILGGNNLYEAVAATYFEPDFSQEDKNAIIDEAVRVILLEFPPRK